MQATNASQAPTELLTAMIRRRSELGLSQGEVAQQAGISRITVSRLEAEGADPQLSTVVKVATVLGLQLTLDSAPSTTPPLPRDLTHRGVAHHRTRQNLDWEDRKRERTLAKAWGEVNKVHPVGLSPVLPTLLPDCTQAQATACATVVQWLGSEVGFDFLTNALAACGYRIQKA